MIDDDEILSRLRDLRKRRAHYRSAERTDRELARLRAFLPARSLERETFELAEVLGHSYKAIAAKLNVSERHLYRIRRRMIEMIGAGEANVRGRHGATGGSRLELAQSLLRYGRAHDAWSVASKSLCAGDFERVQLLTLQAAIAVHLGGGDAVELVERARAHLPAVQPGKQFEAARRVAFADAYLSYYDGLYETSIDVLERELRPWIEKPFAANDPRMLARDLTFLGMLHQEGGSQQRALQILDVAESALRVCPVVPAGELADVHVQRAFALATFEGCLRLARTEGERALALARTHGLLYEQVWAKLALGILDELAGDAPAALCDVDEALDLGRAVLGGDQLARAHFISSRVEIFAGRLDGTLDHLGETEGLIPPDSLMEPFHELVKARVHRARGNAADTIATASLAIEGFERRKTSTHYLGEAYLARAMAVASLGLDARADAENAVSLLQRGGWTTDQARAQEFAAQMRSTSNRNHVA